jgi:hypothetical protein
MGSTGHVPKRYQRGELSPQGYYLDSFGYQRLRQSASCLSGADSQRG